MKIKFVFLLLICFIALLTNPVFAESTQKLEVPKKKNEQDFFSGCFENQERNRKITLIPYMQLNNIFPGCGVAFRIQKKTFGVQMDSNLTHIFPLIQGGSASNVLLTSLSGMYFPFAKEKNPYGGWNLTLGFGSIFEFRHDLEFLWGPLSIGYQGEWLFFDFGIAATELVEIGFDSSENYKVFIYSHPIPVGPTLKFGMCF